MNEKLKYFFNDIDNSILDDPVHLAKSFLSFMIENTISDTTINNQNNHIAILSDDNSLDFVTRRSLLISDHVLLSNRSKESIKIHTNYSETHEFPFVDAYFTYNNDLNALGGWLKKVRSLLISGNISYIPNAYIYSYECDALGNEYSGADIKTVTNFDAISKGIIQSKKIISVSPGENLAYLAPILKIDIPIIDNVDLETYSNIALENLDSLQYFQTYLKLNILNATDLSEKNMTKISLEIQSQLNDIKRLYSKTINKYNLGFTVDCITTVTAILFAMHPNIPDIIKILSGVGGGSGLLQFLHSNIEYLTLNDTLKDNNCYFLWVLQHEDDY